MVQLVDGNLLDSPANALVNSVNNEGVMGKGIALQFKKRFPAMFEAYCFACQAGDVKPGKMHFFALGEACQPRFIINFPTKRDWRSPSRLEDIESGLHALAQEIYQREIRSVAIPALGCGNGGLGWDEVYQLIQGVLGRLDGVRVLVYQPKP